MTGTPAMQCLQWDTARSNVRCMVLSIALGSQKPGTGKTTTAVFLCQSLADAGFTPILIDADKGRSAERWANLAGEYGGLPFPVVSLQQHDMHRRLPPIINGKDAVVIDVPQFEDHRRIARGAFRFADVWLLPVAPAGIEFDRVMDPEAKEFVDEVQAERVDNGQPEATVLMVLNRTNRDFATATGPDAEIRQVLEDQGWTVAKSVIPYHDARFRQTFGLPIDADPAFNALLEELQTYTKRGR